MFYTIWWAFWGGFSGFILGWGVGWYVRERKALRERALWKENLSP